MTHGHGSKRGRSQELLYDPEIPTPTHAERALTLVSQARTATLCTLSVEPTGYPYGSFVTFALLDNAPIFLVSELAEHTKNLQGDSHCSLLVAEDGEGDPLARGRVTLVGQCQPLVPGSEIHGRAREGYLQVHPNASYYVDFQDFAIWRLEVENLRYIGGYGRMSWVTQPDWQASRPDPIAPHAHAILQHMNEDHADTLTLYCRAFSRAVDVDSARMTGIDRYGFEMSAQTSQGPRPIRVAFPQAISSPQDSREVLVALAKQARSALS